MKVQAEVQLYEIDGEKQDVIDAPILVVKSHRSHGDRVTLLFDGKAITMDGNELAVAINKCQWSRI